MNRIPRILVAVLLTASPVLGQEGRVRSDNWMQRPDIRQIRELYSRVERAVEAGLYGSEESKCFCGGEPVVAVLFADSAGVARKYEYQNVTSRAVVEARYYYDREGRLRFVFQSVTAANGAGRELRVYYDDSGRTLYRDDRLIEGPDRPVPFKPPVWQPREDLASACGCATVRSDVRVTDIQARLFCDQTGGFTADVIGERRPALWNTIIGEGDAGCASESTLVLVVIDAPPSEFLGDGRVSVLAMTASETDAAPDTLAYRTVRLGISGEDGRYFVPLWLYDTGCTPIELHAWVEGARQATERREEILFMCGE
jgi:hypothetical protein